MKRSVAPCTSWIFPQLSPFLRTSVGSWRLPSVVFFTPSLDRSYSRPVFFLLLADNSRHLSFGIRFIFYNQFNDLYLSFRPQTNICSYLISYFVRSSKAIVSSPGIKLYPSVSFPHFWPLFSEQHVLYSTVSCIKSYELCRSELVELNLILLGSVFVVKIRSQYRRGIANNIRNGTKRLPGYRIEHRTVCICSAHQLTSNLTFVSYHDVWCN